MNCEICGNEIERLNFARKDEGEKICASCVQATSEVADTRVRANTISGDIKQVLKGMDKDFFFEMKENMIFMAMCYVMADREIKQEKEFGCKIKKLEARLKNHRHAGQSGQFMDQRGD